MDNYKIGKLIAKLRKEKGLTQQALGELVGVGDRAVSKWERGITCPDISIINDLSEILGISSNELLDGELKEQPQEEPTTNNDSNETRSNPIENFISKHKLIIILILTFLIITIPLLILNSNKTYVYDMTSVDQEYAVDGKVIFEKDTMRIIVNKIEFKNRTFLRTIIKNYEYDIKSADTFLCKYGYIDNINITDQNKSIKDITKNLNINQTIQLNNKRNNIINNDLKITFRFIDENNKEITKEINVDLSEPTK